MEPDKEHIRPCFVLFCFHQKKNATHGIIYKTYGNVIAIMKTCANRFKNGDFEISDKERSGRPTVLWKRNKLRKDGKKWKTMENISINLSYINFLL